MDKTRLSHAITEWVHSAMDKYGYFIGEEQELVDLVLPFTSAWISVKDRLPEEYDKVLVWDSFYNSVDIVMFQLGNWYDMNAEKIEVVHHWMPLPEPPESSTL